MRLCQVAEPADRVACIEVVMSRWRKTQVYGHICSVICLATCHVLDFSHHHREVLVTAVSWNLETNRLKRTSGE
jgi:hypothetical protein